MRKQSWTAAAQRKWHAFTLVEMLISIVVLALLILLATQAVNTTATVARPANKHIDTDSEARVVLDRMALDLAQMLKRTDVDYYVKGPTNYTGHGNGHGWGRRLQTGQLGSDQIAFFSQVAGYNSTSSSWQSPVSLTAYRVNQSASTNPAYLRLERMGKGLLWNGVLNATSGTNVVYPIVFLPQTISGISAWSAAVNNNNNCGGSSNSSCDPDYETIGPGVFRFEYYYLLKNGLVTDVPWDRDARPAQTSLTNPENIGLKDVETIAVAIAVIDPAGRALIDAASSNSLLALASDLVDFKTAPGRGIGGPHQVGDMEANWKTVIETVAATGQTSSGSRVPPEAAKAIRIYNRYFDLKTL